MPFGQCSIDGFAADCAEVARRAAHGSAVFEVTFNSGERRQISPRDIGLGYVPTETAIFVDEWVEWTKVEEETVTVIEAEDEVGDELAFSMTINTRNVRGWVDTGFSFALTGGGLQRRRSAPQKGLPNAPKLDYVKFGECVNRMYGVTGIFLPNPDGSGRWVGNRSDGKILTVTLDAKKYDVAALTSRPDRTEPGSVAVGWHPRGHPDYRFFKQEHYVDTAYVANPVCRFSVG